MSSISLSVRCLAGKGLVSTGVWGWLGGAVYGAVSSAGVSVPVCLRRPAHLDMLRARFRVVVGASA